MEPITGVIVDEREVHMLQIVLDADVEETIIVLWDASLPPLCTPPAVVSVTPCSVVLFTTPRIPHQQKPNARLKLELVKD